MDSAQSQDGVSRTSRRMQTRIIEAVVATVAESGLTGTTLASVARKAEVSQGVLIFHFRSKEGLLGETLRRLTAEYRDHWEAAIADGDPLQRIAAMIDTDFSPEICRHDKLALWFAFWGEAAQKPFYAAICEEAERARYDAMVAACRDYVAQAGGPKPELLAQSIDGMTDGLWLQIHLFGGAFEPKEARRAALRHLALLLPGEADRIDSMG